MNPIKKMLKKCGNSWGLTFNRTHLELLDWDPVNTLLEITYDTANKRVTIEPSKKNTSIFAKKGDFESGTK